MSGKDSVTALLTVLFAAASAPAQPAAPPAAIPADGPAGAASRPASRPADDLWNVVEVLPAAVPPQVIRRHPRNHPASQPAATGVHPAGGMFRSTLALGGVVALILLLSWGYRAMTGAARLPRMFRGRAPGLLEVVGRLTLSPRQGLTLVRVGSRIVLVGSTSQSLTALDVVADADEVARLLGRAAAAQSDSHVAGFERLLKDEAAEFLSREEQSPPSARDDSAPDGVAAANSASQSCRTASAAGRLNELRRRLGISMSRVAAGAAADATPEPASRRATTSPPQPGPLPASSKHRSH